MYQSDYLIGFAVVARERSFSRAALESNTSQSSLSRHVRSLETSMGLQLLERGADGVRLTADGLEIYAKVAAIMEALEQIDFYVSERQHPLELTVCGLEVFPRHYRMVLERLEGFAWRGRPVGCRMLGDDALDGDDPWRAVREGRVSLCVLPHLAGMGDPGAGMVCQPLFEGRVMAVMDAFHPLAARPSLAARDLEGVVPIHAESNYHHARQ